MDIAPNTNTSKYNAIKHYIYNPKHNRHDINVRLSNFQTYNKK